MPATLLKNSSRPQESRPRASLLAAFMLAGGALFSSCSNDNAPRILQIHDTMDKKPAAPERDNACIVEWPYDDPVLTETGHKDVRKFYDFCRQCVVVTWRYRHKRADYIPAHETIPFSALAGTDLDELAEVTAAYQDYLHQKAQKESPAVQKPHP